MGEKGNKENKRGWKSWDYAWGPCREKGGELATHFTRLDLEYLFLKVIPSGKDFDNVWVGGSIEWNYAKNWEWLNKDVISADDRLWRAGSPRWNGGPPNCLYISRDISPDKTIDGTEGPAYVKSNCNIRLPYLCEIK